MIKVIIAAPFVLALALTGTSAITPHDELYRFNYENVLGTSLELTFSATSEHQAHNAEAAALAEIQRESGILSSWDAASEFSRWTRTVNQPVRVSPELFEVLSLYDRWRTRTAGALDASAEAVIDVWKGAAVRKRVPTAAELNAAVAKTQQLHWRLDSRTGTATHLTHTPLVLASFTKSYILSHAADAAMKTGVNAAVVNIGGDLTVRGTLSEPVGIANPRADADNDPPIATLRIQNRAVATSGDYRRGFSIGGQHYSHIVDPRTGIPADDVISSTVTAPNAVDAGALATAFSVMKPEESERLARSIPGVEYLLVKKSGEQVTSAGWKMLALAAPPQHRSLALLAAADEWDPTMALAIHVELARSFGFAKRPYLAAWVEDGSHANVRTLALWYGKPRYLNELRAWSRTQHAAPWQTASGASSVSGATRGPGNYTIDWDGKDSAGKFVRPGKYTICLEVVREHGTYQLMKKEMNFDRTPSQAQFPANTEVSGAAFDYHRLSGK